MALRGVKPIIGGTTLVDGRPHEFVVSLDLDELDQFLEHAADTPEDSYSVQDLLFLRVRPTACGVPHAVLGVPHAVLGDEDRALAERYTGPATTGEAATSEVRVRVPRLCPEDGCPRPEDMDPCPCYPGTNGTPG